MKQYILLASMFLAIVVLAGCGSELRGQQLNETIAQDSCFGIVCGENEICIEGSCGCAEDYKTCNNQCIPENSCCSDDECGIGESCVNNACTFSCENVQCESNKICSEKRQGCFCKEGYKWCELQNSCIPEDHCCTRFECDRDQRCIDTAIRAEVCLEKDNDMNCKILNDLDAKEFLVGGIAFEILLSDNFYTEMATILINEQSHNMTPGLRKLIESGAIVWLRNFDEVGGSCKVFDSRRIGKEKG